jgi:hypothetical protein
MAAVNFDLLTKVVARTLPFHFTTEPEANPVPFMVSVNPAELGLIASGTKGRSIRGTGRGFVVVALSSVCVEASCAARAEGTIKAAETTIAISESKVRDFMACSLL